MKKNDEIELEIIDNGINLEGIARAENKVVFVPGAIEGEKVLGFYYVENGQKYIEDGRFCRSKYLGKGEDLFL